MEPEGACVVEGENMVLAAPEGKRRCYGKKNESAEFSFTSFACRYDGVGAVAE
jgi:hypothetical protein